MSAAATKETRAGLSTAPQTEGPRVRLGVLWFFIALAAVTSGRWWTGVLMAALAALAGAQTIRAWAVALVPGAQPADLPELRTLPIAAGAGAAAVPLAAAWGTGLAGVVLAVVALVSGAGMVRRDDRGHPTLAAALAVATVLPAIAATSVVLAVRIDVWAGVAIVVGVSLFDAGSFLLGADASSKWEGPVAGVIGALAVVFTMSTLQVGGIDRGQWWIAGSALALTCVVGLWVVSWALPSPTSWAPAMRRLDAYLVAGPVFVGLLWGIAR